jgi:DNA-binding transcriptional ArsR family regulator
LGEERAAEVASARSVAGVECEDERALGVQTMADAAASVFGVGESATAYIHREAVARVRLADVTTYERVADLFGALGGRTRVKIVHALQQQELCTGDLAALVGVTESAVSQHLRTLRALHIVKARRAGKFVYYSLYDTHVALLLQMGLAHQGHADESLDLAHAKDSGSSASEAGRQGSEGYP